MKYLIAETTQDERAKLVYKALGISLSGAQPPSKEVMNLANEYIKGNLELREVQEMVVNMYKHNKKRDDK